MLVCKTNKCAVEGMSNALIKTLHLSIAEHMRASFYPQRDIGELLKKKYTHARRRRDSTVIKQATGARVDKN